jgi:hypothetical protein
MPWIVTNFDYEAGTVSDAFGPFETAEEAWALAQRHAEAELEELKAGDHPDAELEVIEEGKGIEIFFPEPSAEEEWEGGCLYSVVELQEGD